MFFFLKVVKLHNQYIHKVRVCGQNQTLRAVKRMTENYMMVDLFVKVTITTKIMHPQWVGKANLQ